MKRLWLVRIGLAGTMLLSITVRATENDPYEPLKLYDGRWEVNVTKPEKRTDHLENHRARTGTFFVCEQVVNGKTGALVVFLPTGKTNSGAQEYRMQALRADASAAGEWSHLVIDGETWNYSWEQTEAGKVVHWRNINRFSGKDRIQFDLQNSDDGTNWKTQLSGEEQRIKP